MMNVEPNPNGARKFKTFEDMHVYQQAHKLADEVYALTRIGAFARDRGLVDQIRRAGVSVLSNIAEGFERGSNAEFIQFLYIAKGSAGEVRAQLSIARSQGTSRRKTTNAWPTTAA
jgi:four helix bundle protein